MLLFRGDSITTCPSGLLSSVTTTYTTIPVKPPLECQRVGVTYPSLLLLGWGIANCTPQAISTKMGQGHLFQDQFRLQLPFGDKLFLHPSDLHWFNQKSNAGSDLMLIYDARKFPCVGPALGAFTIYITSTELII